MSAPGPAQRRVPIRLPQYAEARPEQKGYLCAQVCAFNLHAATGRGEPGVAGFRHVAPNDKQG